MFAFEDLQLRKGRTIFSWDISIFESSANRSTIGSTICIVIQSHQYIRNNRFQSHFKRSPFRVETRRPPTLKLRPLRIIWMGRFEAIRSSSIRQKSYLDLHQKSRLCHNFQKLSSWRYVRSVFIRLTLMRQMSVRLSATMTSWMELSVAN